MTLYALAVQTPQGEVFNGKVNFLSASGQQGDVGILGQHAAMIIALKAGVLKAVTEDGEKYFAHQSGILEVKPNHDVLVLVDEATAAMNLAEAKEQAAALTVVKK